MRAFSVHTMCLSLPGTRFPDMAQFLDIDMLGVYRNEGSVTYG